MFYYVLQIMFTKLNPLGERF